MSLSVRSDQVVELFQESVNELEVIRQFIQRKSKFAGGRHPILLIRLLMVWMIHVV
jgi:hypothetical protein